MKRVAATVVTAVALIVAPFQAASAEQALDPESPEFKILKEQLAKDFVRSPERSREIARLQHEYPDQGSPIKYEKSGHLYATYIVAKAANLTTERAHELAYFAQFPDEEIEFSALLWYFDFDWPFRYQVMATLHSLHGGRQEAVVKRRRDLQAFIRDGFHHKRLKDYQLGLAIHAIADAYSHTKIENGELKAFGFVWGHLFHGSKPDLIDHDPVKFKHYSCALYIALSSKYDCSLALNELHWIIDGLASKRNDALRDLERHAIQKSQFNINIYAALDKTWKNKINKVAVKETIELIEARIRNQSATR